MKINGKNVKLLLDLGAMKKFKEITGKNFFQIGTDFDPDSLGALVSVSAERAGNKLTDEEIDSLTINELNKLREELLGDVEETGGNPPKVSRRK